VWVQVSLWFAGGPPAGSWCVCQAVAVALFA